MKQNAHTPGPWTALRTNPHLVCGGFRGCVIGQFERAADAQLAIAAPALLAALESLLDAVRQNDERGQPPTADQIFAAAGHAALAAIASARGEG